VIALQKLMSEFMVIQMQNSKDASINDLKKYTVAIKEIEPNTENFLGTGFVITDDGLILTCYHVVGNTEEKRLYYEVVNAYFPEAKIAIPAEVAKEYCNPEIDIAVLRLRGKLPPQNPIAYLGPNISYGHKFTSIGFRKTYQFKELSSDGDIRIITTLKNEEGIESIPVIQLYSLSNDRLVFITGTKEYGKTYTAVRLLWEYFNKGYEPIWYRGDNEEDRSNVRNKLVKIENVLKPGHII
jgi:hypothetical protein